MDSIFISEHQEETQMSNANTAPLMANQNAAVLPSHILDQTIAFDAVELPEDYAIASAQPVPSLSPSSMGEQQPVFLTDVDQQPLYWGTLNLPIGSSPSSSLPMPSTQQQQPSFMSSSSPELMAPADLTPIAMPLPTTSSPQLIYSSREQQQPLQPQTMYPQNTKSNNNRGTVALQPTSESCSSPVASTPSSSERGNYLCRVSHNCRATFTRRSDRDRHELIHKPPRTLYTCEYCNITCTRKDTLKRHQTRSCPVINACKHQSSSSSSSAHASRG